ncbi:MAG TPA: glycosyl transferase family 2, partial [Lachnospiraceae bacterium]|nr:glycosyl transferase family 2 [Lachnospiraceae bacterium]
SQSLEFQRAGYCIAVPYQKSPWVLHDCGFLHLKNYYRARDQFIEEYKGEY